MARATALDFQRNFGDYQHLARHEPVEITRHGRREFVLMSVEHYDSLTSAAERVHRTGDADVLIDAADVEADLERPLHEDHPLISG
jgi:prevent-host-death family protein